MSWADLLQDPTFRGVPLEVVSTSRQGGKQLAQHQVPYTNGAELQDMGNEPHGFDLRVIVRGESYEADLARLVAALELSGTGDLVDPIIGTVQVMVAHWAIDHNAEAPDSCELSIRFLEQGSSALLFSLPAASSSTDLAAAAGEQARSKVVAAAGDKLAKAAASRIPRITAINDALAQAKAKLRTLLDTTSVRVLLSDLDPLIYPKAALGDLLSIVDGAFQGLPFGGLNPLHTGSTVGIDPMPAAQSDFARLVQGQPVSLVINPVSSNPDDLDVASVVTAVCQVANATAVANGAGLILAAEVNLLGLSADDIERLAATARTALLLAMFTARTALGGQEGAEAAEHMARMAVHIQDAARTALEQRPPVIRRTAPMGGHARLIAHTLYGDHTRAPQLQRLNNWGRHVLIEAGQEMLAYAQ